MKYQEVRHQNFHIQGFTSDGENVYWSFTDSLVKTNSKSTLLRQVPSAINSQHLGCIDYFEGKIYGAAMGHTLKGKPKGTPAPSFDIHVYDAETLSLIRIIRLDECFDLAKEKTYGFTGVGCVAVRRDKESGEPVMLVGSAIENKPENENQLVLEFDLDGNYRKKYLIKTGVLNLGVQNIDVDPETDEVWLAAYGYSEKHPYLKHESLYKLSPDMSEIRAEYIFQTPYGFHCLGGGKYLASVQDGENTNTNGYAYLCDEEFMKEISKNEIDEFEMMEFIRARFDEKVGF